MKYLYRLLIVFILVGCSTTTKKIKEEIVIKDNGFSLIIKTSSFQFRFEDSNGEVVVPENEASGLLINNSPITKIRKNNSTNSKHSYVVENENGVEANVKVTFKEGVVKFSIESKIKKEGSITLQVGGMPIAHGLGDAGSYKESFNLLENSNKIYPIINNGATQRWTSTFAIFPKNDFAGVYFTEGEKNVSIAESAYAMKIVGKENVDFYYFIGTPKTIYKNYKNVRNKEGFLDVFPKSRLFELGWESWDALGWNTSQITVKEILQMYLDKGFPIKWAVTGSGFWKKGGTTTNFGQWGDKFSNAKGFKDWMHSKDIHWMIGLRTNFVPEGGPYVPESFKKDRNTKL